MCAAESKGKTLHLLKKASKPVPQYRKRIKRSVFGEHTVGDAVMEEDKRKDPLPTSYAGMPNIIGNKDSEEG